MTRLLTHNRLLEALPPHEQRRLAKDLVVESLLPGTVLAQPGDSIERCYFPTGGMISLLAATEQGQTIEVAFTGHEGMLGLATILGRNEMPYQALVQAPADMFVADRDVVIELFGRSAVFHDFVLRYAYALLKQAAQSCVCNHFHSIEARLCRWLTVMCERSGTNYLSLTQEFVAHMLGVQRTSIGLIASAMQNKGVIRYRRGRVEVIELDTLRDNACECYWIVRRIMEGLYKDR